MLYTHKYFKRHLDYYRDWEKNVGHNIASNYHIKSVLDLGCGIGSYLEGFYNYGVKDILGIELNFEQAKDFFVDCVQDKIIKGDITKNLNLGRTFDCVISFEVGEHIEPEGSVNFVENLARYSDRYIILTAAPPGQRGTGHINLKEKSIWINDVVSRGFEYKPEQVERLTDMWKNFNVEKYILRNLMFFERKK